MEHRIETREPAVSIAYRMTGDYTKCDYGKAWQQLMKYCEANKEALGHCFGDMEFINMYYNDPTKTPPEECKMDVCLAAKPSATWLRDAINGLPLTDEIQRATIPGGRYIVFVHKGPYEKLGEAYGYIYCHFLPKGEVTDDSEARGGMFESYLNNPETTPPEDLITEIWVPIV